MDRSYIKNYINIRFYLFNMFQDIEGLYYTQKTKQALPSLVVTELSITSQIGKDIRSKKTISPHSTQSFYICLFFIARNILLNRFDL